MKYIIVSIVLLTVSISSNAYVFAKDWTKTNTAMEIADWGLMWVDYKQTIRLLKPDMSYKQCEQKGICFVGREYHREGNSLLGKYPSRSRLINAGLAYGVTHTLISAALPPRWRQKFQKFTTKTRAYFVIGNRHAGIKIDF